MESWSLSPATGGSSRGTVCPEAPDTGTELVCLHGVSRHFGDVAAVDELSLTLRRGEFFSLLGPSGCGKTTTLRMIAGFEYPDAGVIEIDGQDVVRLPPNERPVNTVFQSYALFSHLNVHQNVAFGLRERRAPRGEIETAVGEALALVRLSGYEQRKPRQLSGGEQQRVALARAIVNEPAVLLLDEPLGALDLKLRRAMQLELKSIQQRLGMTFLYVTHDQEEALTMSDRVGVMEQGKLAQVGTPLEIYTRPASPYVADFVGEANILSGTVVEAAGGRVSVAVSGASALAGIGGDLKRGDPARLVVRPEAMRLIRDDGAGGPETLSGTVAEVVFVGHHWKILIDAAEAGILTVTSPSRTTEDGPPLGVGERVQATWRVDDAWVI
jgi:spermidine/putrescine transport system ATP-binding protein